MYTIVIVVLVVKRVIIMSGKLNKYICNSICILNVLFQVWIARRLIVIRIVKFYNTLYYMMIRCNSIGDNKGS